MISRGSSQQSSAPYNRRIVLDLIRRAGEISRKEIVDQVSLSPQTVANITQELESSGIVVSRRRKVEKSRGQPPIVFALNPGGGQSIGISMEPGSMTGALVNLVGDIIGRDRRELDTNDPECCLEAMLDMISGFRNEPSASAAAWGIGVSLPGPFDAEELSFVGPTVFEGWQDLGILDALHEKTGLHVCYSTDSIAGALGESLYGVATHLDNFFYIHLGIGLGGVLVNGATAYQGANGNATALGHVPIGPGGKPCYCGTQGCLEQYVSLHAFKTFYSDRGLGPPQSGQLAELIGSGDATMAECCEEASMHLRNAVCFIENTLDPETIVIGGSAPQALVEKLIEGASPWLHSVRGGSGKKTARVIPARYQEESAILGAAVLPIYDMISPRLDVLQKQDSPELTADTLFGRHSRPNVGRL